MGYYIDLTCISIDDYRRKLKTADLFPSQRILKDGIDEAFSAIETQGIENVEQLRNRLGTKKKRQAFAEQTGISDDYLKILIRNVNSYRQRPTKIRDFPDVSEDTAARLEGLGITNTLQLYDRILTPEGRKELAGESGAGEKEVLRLAKLSDLCRIRWVSHTFAYVLAEAGYDTAEKVARADSEQLYREVKTLNAEREIFRGHVGAHDMKLCVEAAQELPFEIEC